jgi:hypothetical protein
MNVGIVCQRHRVSKSRRSEGDKEVADSSNQDRSIRNSHGDENWTVARSIKVGGFVSRTAQAQLAAARDTGVITHGKKDVW